MTIDQAIKLLQADIDNPGSVAIEDVNKAETLGIEALKRVRDNRGECYTPISVKLPGETEG